MPVLNSGGTYVSTIPNPNNLKAMALTQFKSLFSKKTKKAQVVMVTSNGSDLADIAKLISVGRMSPVIDQIYPVQQTAQAHDYSRSLRAKGKIILKIQ